MDKKKVFEDAGANQGKDMEEAQGLAFAEARRPGARRPPRAKTSRAGVVLFSIVMFAVGAALGYWLFMWTGRFSVCLVAALVVGALFSLTFHISLQWERVVILRLGKFSRVAGPGFYLTIPVVEYATLRVDQRIRCTYFSGERILTSDLVPVDVDAVFYWTVWDAKKVSTEVEDYLFSVANAAQTCLRDVIGSVELEELATRRPQIDAQVRNQIAELTEEWGVSVTTVKIRDIVIPAELHDALSKAAQAQRERDARMIMSEVEGDIAEMLVNAAETYAKNPYALQLRAIQAASDGVKDGGLVLAPSSLADALGNPKDFIKACRASCQWDSMGLRLLSCR